MKRSIKELKQLSREALIGNYSNFAIIYLVYFLITFGIETIPALFANDTSTKGFVISQIVTIILSIILSVLAVGLQKSALNIARKKPAEINDLFFAFKHNPDRYIVVTFLTALIAVAFQIPTFVLIFIFAATALLTDTALFILLTMTVMLIMLIISLIVLLRYAMSFILLLENPDMGAIEAMKASALLMDGNKARFFMLNLSFLGLQLLALCTCGIGYFWVTPYITTAIVQFYRDITGEIDRPVNEPEETTYEYQDYWS